MPVLANEKVDPEALEIMRKRGGRWAAYQNQHLSSHNAGHLQFLSFGGEVSTYEQPPKTYPKDTYDSPGWKYIYVGELNLRTGEIE